MEIKANGSQRIAPAEVDGAITEALARVEQADQLSKDDLNKASGGTVTQPVGFIGVE